MKSVVLITGAAGGIGIATCKKFLENGYITVGIDLTENSSISNFKNNPDFSFIIADVSSEMQIRHGIKHIYEMYGHIDVLVNLAGILVVKPLEKLKWSEFRKITDVNLGGTFLMVKHTIPIMKKQGGGVIVNVASVNGHIGHKYSSLYGATKAGIISLTKTLAIELAPYNIRVNSVSPGTIDTEMLKHNIKEEARIQGFNYNDVMEKSIKDHGGWGKPEDVANVIYFLAGPNSNYINGADIVVDNGLTAR